jgi:hypothetical protein
MTFDFRLGLEISFRPQPKTEIVGMSDKAKELARHVNQIEKAKALKKKPNCIETRYQKPKPMTSGGNVSGRLKQK